MTYRPSLTITVTPVAGEIPSPPPPSPDSNFLSAPMKEEFALNISMPPSPEIGEENIEWITDEEAHNMFLDTYEEDLQHDIYDLSLNKYEDVDFEQDLMEIEDDILYEMALDRYEDEYEEDYDW